MYCRYARLGFCKISGLCLNKPVGWRWPVFGCCHFFGIDLPVYDAVVRRSLRLGLWNICLRWGLNSLCAGFFGRCFPAVFWAGSCTGGSFSSNPSKAANRLCWSSAMTLKLHSRSARYTVAVCRLAAISLRVFAEREFGDFIQHGILFSVILTQHRQGAKHVQVFGLPRQVGNPFIAAFAAISQ